MLILPSVCLSFFFIFCICVESAPYNIVVSFLHAPHVFSDWIISMEANQVQFLPLTILPYSSEKNTTYLSSSSTSRYLYTSSHMDLSTEDTLKPLCSKSAKFSQHEIKSLNFLNDKFGTQYYLYTTFTLNSKICWFKKAR